MTLAWSRSGGLGLPFKLARERIDTAINAIQVTALAAVRRVSKSMVYARKWGARRKRVAIDGFAFSTMK
jgi:hypothetical protein